MRGRRRIQDPPCCLDSLSGACQAVRGKRIAGEEGASVQTSQQPNTMHSIGWLQLQPIPTPPPQNSPSLEGPNPRPPTSNIKPDRHEVLLVHVHPRVCCQPDGSAQDVVGHTKGGHQPQCHTPQLTAQRHNQPLNGLGLQQDNTQQRTADIGFCVLLRRMCSLTRRASPTR